MSPAPRTVPRPLTGLLLLILVGAAIGASLAIHQVVRNQEHKLLRERAAELNLVLSEVTGSTAGQLATVGLQLRERGADPVAAFRAVKPRAAAGASQMALLQVGGGPGGSVETVAADGPGLAVGQPVDPRIAQTAVQATHASTIVATPVVKRDSRYVVGIALGPPAAPPGYVLYQESVVHPGQVSPATTGPYSELDVALYDGAKADPGQLISNNAPLAEFRSDRATSVVHIGASPFLVVVAARQPLVGSVEQNAQWYVLGAGLVLALLVGGMFETIQRRREYALELVDERTAALNESLTALHAARDQMVAQERLAAIGQLASAVGHELRNPLGVITNALYLLRRATAASGDQRIPQNLEVAEREVAAANLIVSDLLEFSRPRQPMLGEVDVGELVDEALSVAPHPRSVHLEWQPPPETVHAWADRVQLRQVLLNLLTNAYDAVPDGGTVRIEAGVNGANRVRLAVTDDGPGMEPDVLARIFEPFFTTKPRGVGLGLAVSSRIMEAHDGGIEIVSQPGQGTTFTLTLPDRDPGTVA